MTRIQGCSKLFNGERKEVASRFGKTKPNFRGSRASGRSYGHWRATEKPTRATTRSRRWMTKLGLIRLSAFIRAIRGSTLLVEGRYSVLYEPSHEQLRQPQTREESAAVGECCCEDR